jgi:hypothetical protein
MKTRAVAVLALLFLAGGLIFAVPSRAETSAQMAGFCEPYRAAFYVGEGKIRVKSNENSFVCWGAFASIQGLGTLVLREGDGTMLHLCLPARSGRLELIKVFIRYMDQHPNRGHEDFGPLVLDSLWEAFPCPVRPSG